MRGTDAQQNPRNGITCLSCRRYGHFSNKCREYNHVDGTTLAVVECNNTENVEAAFATLDGDGKEGCDEEMYEVVFCDAASSEFTFFNKGIADDDDTVDGSYDGGLYKQYEEATGSVMSDDWILLDNQSTVHLFKNGSLLNNIREADHTCRVKCMVGVVTG